MSTKKALKDIRAQLTAQDAEGALQASTSLLKLIGDKDADAPTVLAFRALALTHLDRTAEAEKSYLHALALAPGHALARPGLRKLYIKHEEWDKLGSLLEYGVQAAYDANDADGVVAAMQDLVQHRQAHGPEEKLYDALSLLLPSSPLVPLITTTPVPAGGYVALPAPTYPPTAGTKTALPSPLPHVYYLAGALPLVLYVLIHVQAHIHTITEAKVKAGRMRIGARSERDVRRQVDAEVLGGPLGTSMVDLLRDVAAHPAVEEGTRREVEVQEFRYWCKLVAVLPGQNKKDKAAPAAAAKPKSSMIIGGGASTPKPAAEDTTVPPLFRAPAPPKLAKSDALERANGLADGFVLLGLGGVAEDGWLWVMDGTDEPTPSYDLDFLHRFAKAFPTSTLTDFIDDYCRLFKLPLPEPEEDEAEEAGKETADGDKTAEKVKYKRPRRGKNKGVNSRERRKARRLAERDGHLAEDVDEEEREELIASMTKLVERLSKSVFALRVMARVAIQDEDWVNAIAYAEKARKLVRDLESERGIKLPAVQLSLDGQLGVALVPYYPPKHHERAARLLNGVLDAHPDDYAARFAVGEIAETAGEWAGARAHFQRLLDAGSADEREIVAAREEVGWCLVNEGDLEAGRDVLESVVELRDSHKEAAEAAATAAHKEFKDDEAFARARAWWRLGRTEWELGGAEARAHAEEWFMASLRADATFAPAYTALGICYAEQRPPDAERALKCFQKAFELDATEADAARRLAYGYAAEDEWAQVRAIATRVMEGEGGVEGVAAGAVKPEPGSGRFAPKNAWAWKALGSTEMYYKNYTKALSAYQIALRATPDDADMWRMLGDAYAKSGRHMAALKALQHALDLDPDMWLARYTVGEVYLQLGEHVRAIEAFTEIDESVGGTEAGVTAALAEAALALGRHAASGGFVARARSAFTDAIKHAARVLRARAHRAWGWKLVGDCTLLLAEYEREADGEAEGNEEADALRPVLELLVADDDDRRSAVAGLGHASNLLQQPTGTPHTTLKAAVFAYAYRAHLLKNEPRVADAALYDLACGLHALSLRSEEDRAAATKAAVAAVRLALEREPGDERLWNALAVVAASAPQLAQHALVVALECYPKDTAVWTNLGYLYLQLDERELANACLLRAQTLDPDHARAWFGQAVLAQRDGQEEAAGNLFAHAATLAGGALLEADLALAVAAFARSTATAANGGDAAAVLHEPAFALKRYVGACPRDAAAQHLYGLVCERLGLADAAVSALAAAVVRFEDEYEATESSDVEASYLVAVANLARARLGSGEYAAALEAYASFEELAAGSSDVRVAALAAQAHLGSALAHFHTGDLDASLASFQSALDASKNDPSASDEITVLLARTLWGVGGTDARDAAKTQLLGALEGNPGVRVIAALGAAGLGSGDADLVDAAVAELSGVPPSRRAAEDPAGGAALVQYASALVSGDQAAAVSALEAAAASDARPAPRNALAAAYIAAGKPEAADTLLAGAGADADAARLRGEALVLSGDDAGIAYLQRAVRLRPWDDSAWEALAWARRAVAELEE